MAGTWQQAKLIIETLREKSLDVDYTQYLSRLEGEIPSWRPEDLWKELKRTYDLYLRRNPTAVPDAEILRALEGSAQKISNPVRLEPSNPPAPPLPPRKNMEATVGVMLFGIIGTAFILTAFVILGSNYLSGLMRGVSLYGISLLLCVVSEFVLYRKNRKIGMLFSSIGVGGLYLSTALNYNPWRTLSGIAAIIVTVVITLGIAMLSRRRDSGLLRLICVSSCQFCLLLFAADGGMAEFLMTGIILFLVNVLCVLLPVKKHFRGICTAHLFINAFFTILYVITFQKGMAWPVYVFGFVLLSFLASLLICRKLMSGSILSFWLNGVLFIVLLSETILDCAPGQGYLCMGLTALVCLVFFLLAGSGDQKWFYYYLLQAVVVLTYVFHDGEGNVFGTVIFPIAVMLFLLLLSKLLTGIKCLAADEAVISALACIVTIYFRRTPWAWMLMVGLLLSLSVLHTARTYYEILIAGTFLIFLGGRVPAILLAPMVMGSCFAFLLLTHGVRRFRGKRIRLLEIFLFMGQGAALLLMNFKGFQGTILLRTSVLIYGLATILLLFGGKYGLKVRYRNLILTLFLTYMVFVFRIRVPVLTSILLMTVAFVSVLLGFWERQRLVRIYGLTLSLAVCCKLVFWDSIGYDVPQRMIVFFVVGLLALLIAVGYILLEGKRS